MAKNLPGGDADLAAVATLVADPARARILLVLLDGRALPAGRLASEAGVTASTASSHLARLLGGGLVTVEAHGRHRYYRLANDRVAHALEQLSALSQTTPVRSLRDDTRSQCLRRGRMCYDHLAGRLGVQLLTSLLDLGVLNGHDGSFRSGVERFSAPGPDTCYHLTRSGHERLAHLGIDLESPSRRPMIRHCVDWTEQRHHLSGRLGAALAAHLLAAHWVEPGPFPRVVRVTALGATELRCRLGFEARPEG